MQHSEIFFLEKDKNSAMILKHLEKIVLISKKNFFFNIFFCRFEHRVGEAYIAQCATLKLFKYQYLFENFGFTNCTLEDIFDAFRQKRMCEEKLETKIKFLMGFGATS